MALVLQGCRDNGGAGWQLDQPRRSGVAVGQGEAVPKGVSDGLQSAHALVRAPGPMPLPRGTAILNSKANLQAPKTGSSIQAG